MKNFNLRRVFSGNCLDIPCTLQYFLKFAIQLFFDNFIAEINGKEEVC